MTKKFQYIPPKPKQTFELFYFTVHINGEQVEIIQTDDEPFYAVSENVSLLTLPQTDVALHLTWLPEKPPVGSEARKLALAQVMVHLAKMAGIPLEGLQFGIGHDYNAKVEFHEGSKGESGQ